MGEEHQAAGSCWSSSGNKKRSGLVVTRPRRRHGLILAAEMRSDVSYLTGRFCPEITSVTGSSRLLTAAQSSQSPMLLIALITAWEEAFVTLSRTCIFHYTPCPRKHMWLCLVFTLKCSVNQVSSSANERRRWTALMTRRGSLKRWDKKKGKISTISHLDELSGE